MDDIDIVNAELRNVRTQQQKVVQLAKGLLNQGLANENSVQTSTALQVRLFNLSNQMFLMKSSYVGRST